MTLIRIFGSTFCELTGVLMLMPVLTVRLAVRAAAEDGETWRGFVALRLCERAVPALRPGGGASTSPSPSP